MMHVKQIEALVVQGNHEKATEALEDLLAMGPTNTGALKLKAQIFEEQGKFAEARQVWESILRIDAEDPEGIAFFYHIHSEDRERFYFTDELPLGGRRFLAHPKLMLQASVWGLLGCSLFLSMGHVHTFVAFFMHAWVMIALFALLVVSPWLVILYAYTTSLREIVLTHEGITMKTRWKTYQLPWLHTEAVVVAHTPSPLHQLSLWIIPKSEDLPAWQLNLKKGECVIKARGWFVHEMQRCAPKLYYSRQDCLPKRLLKTITF